jgi:hypothetical protein
MKGVGFEGIRVVCIRHVDCSLILSSSPSCLLMFSQAWSLKQILICTFLLSALVEMWLTHKIVQYNEHLEWMKQYHRIIHNVKFDHGIVL